MAKGKWKCKKCDRSFLMPAHLARHENAMHGAKRRAKGTPARAARHRGKAPGRRAGGSAFGGEAFDLIQRMQGYHTDLLSRRQSLDDEIAAIAKAMEAMGDRGGRPAMVRRSPGRPVGSGSQQDSLASHIVRALKSRSTPLSPRDIAQAVLKTGYKTKSQNLTKSVSNALHKIKTVKRVGFGEYRA